MLSLVRNAFFLDNVFLFACLYSSTQDDANAKPQIFKNSSTTFCSEHWQYSPLHLTHRMTIDVKHHCLSLFQLVVVFLHQIDTSQGTILPELALKMFETHHLLAISHHD